MPSTRSGSSYKPSSSSQKGDRNDYGKRQSAKEGQGSVNGSQTDRLCHSEADNTFLPSNEADTATRTLSGHIKKPARRLTTMHCSTKSTRSLKICGRNA
ncbi:hypothetical protein O181_074183 [Austropuccinia psidii MF-1]|uniref:Uncharacterized protein n=1 Tax=Austropuccinia psidii MF-1 TaxID=1389203 RepID=A0A9Q3F6G5_9BASI|nr:hypothetical protein [Austropuccinia psidii MF-1]